MIETQKAGRLFGVGLGPGDPELVTLKALRIVRQAHVIAYPSAKHGQSNARSIVSDELVNEQIELPMIYPITTELTDHPGGYEGAISDFYDDMAKQIAVHLECGRDVAILCEGDPFFYGSYMYLHDRLAHRFVTEVIPGVPSIMAAAARLETPLVRREVGTGCRSIIVFKLRLVLYFRQRANFLSLVVIHSSSRPSTYRIMRVIFFAGLVAYAIAQNPMINTPCVLVINYRRPETDVIGRRSVSTSLSASLPSSRGLVEQHPTSLRAYIHFDGL